MIMRLLLALVLGVWILAPAATAGLYKYVDENGVRCFTDDLTRVPEHQRVDAASLKEYRPPEPPKAEAEPISEKEHRRREREEKGQKLDRKALELTRLKEALDKELQALKTRREELVRDSEKEMTAEEQVEFNKLAKELNDDTLRYKEKREEFLKQVEEHNKKVESL